MALLLIPAGEPRQRLRALKAIFSKEPISLANPLDVIDEKWRKGELDEFLNDDDER
jgi:hypothetical protein